MGHGDHAQIFVEFDERDGVREAPDTCTANGDASLNARDLRVRTRLRRDTSHGTVDRQNEAKPEAVGLLVIPRDGGLELGFGLGFERHLGDGSPRARQ